ncbi:MAG: MBL fold metallo-hydrolase, partial [Bacteroidia bacterium]|nr:MBL fold metallo-hydrolase [Bacteroidia bacterium]
MKLTFHGAARQVTGSMYRLTLDSGYSILIDCGLNYEKDVAREDNANFPFDPEDIDLVLLTHAHVDHSGNLPTLFSQGYEGKILCTEPTLALSDILLSDAANIEADRVNKKRKRKLPTRRLYGHKQVMDVVDSMVTVEFNKPFEVNDQVTVEFLPAGHILGASSLCLAITEKGKTKRLGFTGDLGKSNAKIVVAPEPMKELDYLVMEGTYGARLHKETRSPEETLWDYVQKTCIDQAGRLLIPAFSVGRTQSILFTLNKLFREHGVDDVRVFTDSPLGITSGNIHEEYTSFLNSEARNFVNEYKDLFRFKQLYVVEDREDEAFMNANYRSSIIVSSAGMMNGGRIQRHVANNIENPHCTILIAGYCTPGTLGAELLEGKKTIRIKKFDRHVYARIASTDVFSAHPDQNELKTYFQRVHNASSLKSVFLSHGEGEGLDQLKEVLSVDFQRIEVPKAGQ